MENKPVLLFLDDARNPKDYASKEFPIEQIVWVKNVDAFDSYLKENQMPEMISFDYMLGHREDCMQDGIGAAKSVLRKCLHDDVKWPRWRIHSTFDTVGKLRRYIEHAIDMYDLGDAKEEDRQPNTPLQQALEDSGAFGGPKKEKRPDGGITINEPIQYVQRPGFSSQVMRKPESKPIVKAKTQGRNEPCNCGSGKKFKHCHRK